MSRRQITAATRYDATEVDVLEYASRPAFWWLALFIVASFFATIWAANLGETPGTATQQNLQKEALQTPSRPVPFYTRWLAPYYLRSPVRRLIAIVLYLGVLVLQLRHGAWVLTTWWRLLITVFRQWPAVVIWNLSSLLVHGVYAVSIFCVLGIGLGLAGFGGVVLLSQVQCLLELVLGEWKAPREKSSKDGGA